MLLANEIIVPIKLVLNDIRRDKPIVATILCEFATGTHVYHEAIPWQYTVYTVNASQKANRAHFSRDPGLPYQKRVAVQTVQFRSEKCFKRLQT